MFVLVKSADKYDTMLQMRRNLARSWWTDMSRRGINGNVVCHLKKKLRYQPRFTPFV